MTLPAVPDPLPQLTADVRALVAQVERLTGLKSNWSGTVRIGTELSAAGRPADIGRRAGEDTKPDCAGNAWHPGWTQTMTRKELHDIMFRARTLEQCAEAWKAQAEYLREHPDDESVIEEGEALWMTEQSLKSRAAQK